MIKMKVKLDTEIIQTINLFQNITGSSVKDCINDKEEIYFVVGEGQHGFTVGKNGAKIKHAEKVFKKIIKIFEYSPELEGFIKKMIPESESITIGKDEIVVKVKPGSRAKVIGKGGRNIKIINMFLSRLFNVNNLKVR